MTVSGYGPIRATDADRETVQDALQTAYAEGRLTMDEFEARTTALSSAKTYEQLAALTSDLAPVRFQTGTVAANHTNQLAIASLACGVAQFPFWILTGIPAIVLGHAARRQIDRTGEAGAGLAQVGMILGYVGLAGFVIVSVVLAVVAHWLFG